MTFPVPHPTLGENVAAAIVLGSGAPAATRDELVRQIREFASARLAAFKVPQLVVIVSEIPMDAGGKVPRLESGRATRPADPGPEAVRVRRAPHSSGRAAVAHVGRRVGVGAAWRPRQLLPGGWPFPQGRAGAVTAGTRVPDRAAGQGALRESDGGGIGRGDDPSAGDAARRPDVAHSRRGTPASRARSRSPSSGCGSSTSSSPAIPPTTCTPALRLSGRLSVEALEQSLSEILRRHEALRTTFRTIDGQPVQVVVPGAPAAPADGGPDATCRTRPRGGGAAPGGRRSRAVRFIWPTDRSFAPRW